ncbi:hypothetical protein A2U01_0047051, partial [Trifolium medium]|nr:hypothetical protein [Trifolium medium]
MAPLITTTPDRSPVSAEYLSSRCHYFQASPSLVRHVASLPYSPLSFN